MDNINSFVLSSGSGRDTSLLSFFLDEKSDKNSGRLGNRGEIIWDVREVESLCFETNHKQVVEVKQKNIKEMEP